MTPFDQRRKEARELDKLAQAEKMREQYRKWRDFLEEAKRKRALVTRPLPTLWSN